MKNSEKPVYPLQDKGFPSNESVVDDNSLIGLTKREYFTGLAMQALISNPNIKRPEQNANLKNDLSVFASIAVEYADAVLSELSKHES